MTEALSATIARFQRQERDYYKQARTEMRPAVQNYAAALSKETRVALFTMIDTVALERKMS